MIFFCPECWAHARTEFSICPSCHADVSRHSRKAFEEKLIVALSHPARDTVKLAVWILGTLRSTVAVRPLCDAFSGSSDLFLKSEILAALSLIGTPEARAFIEKSLISEPHILAPLMKRVVERWRVNH